MPFCLKENVVPQYRLYYSPGACSLAAHIAFEELGVACEPIRVVIAEGQNQTAEYLAINPRGRVPALVIREGGREQVLTELSAILIYLAQTYPAAGLLPLDDTLPFVRMVEWMSWLGSSMHAGGVRTVLRPDRFISDPAAAEAVKTRGTENVRIGFADIESRLHGRTWALGEHYSMVDAYLLVFFRWGNRIGLPMRTDYPHYTRIMDAVRARPAVQRAIAHEGIQIE
ncbi:MAG: glutathione S-transferase [Rugosibacter sp.]|nr:MAG: glutathione S-transferase [Rugosibacter sp.]TBR08945.1 MAG: glutathione S-transferase [Rugosibacter sp.]